MMTHQLKKFTHSLYKCKYHVVFCPNYRNKMLQDEVRHCFMASNSDATPLALLMQAIYAATGTLILFATLIRIVIVWSSRRAGLASVF